MFFLGKNEVTLEFHQHDDAEIALMEMRFYVPPNNDGTDADPVKVTSCNLHIGHRANKNSQQSAVLNQNPVFVTKFQIHTWKFSLDNFLLETIVTVS